METKIVIAGVLAIGAAIGAWFGENALIHAAGYTGFGGAGWITAIMVPLGATIWVFEKAAMLLNLEDSDAGGNSTGISPPPPPPSVQPRPIQYHPIQTQPVQAHTVVAQPVQTAVPPADEDDDFVVIIKPKR